MGTLGSFLKLSRPHFLVGGVVMFAVGVAEGSGLGIGTFVLGQAMVTASQVTAHYVNEYADYEVDGLVVNRTIFSGGSGVLVAGHLDRCVALRAAWASTLAALALAAIAASVAPIAALLAVLALLISWLYSIPPIRLLGTGYGEAVTSAIVVGVVPLIGVSITGGAPTDYLWWLMAVLFPVHLAMMLVFELPDVETDRRAGKLVLAVRIGAKAAVAAIGALLALAVVISVAGIYAAGLPHVMWWAVVSMAVGGMLTITSTRLGKDQLSTVFAVATLVAVAGVGLAAAI